MAIGKIEVMTKSSHCGRHYHLTDNLQASVQPKSPDITRTAGLNIHHGRKSILKTGAAFFTVLEFDSRPPGFVTPTVILSALTFIGCPVSNQ